jgi:hypothetical protein
MGLWSPLTISMKSRTVRDSLKRHCGSRNQWFQVVKVQSLFF